MPHTQLLTWISALQRARAPAFSGIGCVQICLSRRVVGSQPGRNLGSQLGEYRGNAEGRGLYPPDLSWTAG